MIVAFELLVLAAFLTPPDPASMLILFALLTALHTGCLLSVLLVGSWLAGRTPLTGTGPSFAGAAP